MFSATWPEDFRLEMYKRELYTEMLKLDKEVLLQLLAKRVTIDSFDDIRSLRDSIKWEVDKA